MTKRQQLEQLANTIPNLKGCKVVYSRGNGYYLKGIYPTVWFSTYDKGMAWLEGYKAAGKGNFAKLRVGVK